MLEKIYTEDFQIRLHFRRKTLHCQYFHKEIACLRRYPNENYALKKFL